MCVCVCVCVNRRRYFCKGVIIIISCHDNFRVQSCGYKGSLQLMFNVKYVYKSHSNYTLILTSLDVYVFCSVNKRAKVWLLYTN